jgi:hypothetical protein
MSESRHQIALFDWWFYACKRFGLPQMAMYATPNGGQRHYLTAVKLKREGVTRGIPDIHLAVPRKGFTCLWIEMKFGKNRLTAEQKDFMAWQETEGAKCAVCYSWEEARTIIEEYLS